VPDLHDHEQPDAELARFFDSFFAATVATAPTPDPGDVLARVRRRRRGHAAVATLIAAATVAIPGGLYLAGGRATTAAEPALVVISPAQSQAIPVPTTPAAATTRPAPERPPNVTAPSAAPPSAPVPNAAVPSAAVPNAAVPSAGVPSAAVVPAHSATVVTHAPTGSPTPAVPTPAGPGPISANDTGCPAGTAQFHNEIAVMGDERYRIGGGYLRDRTPRVAYGDVTRDGTTDALLVVSCLTTAARINPPSMVLLLTDAPAPSTLGLVFSSSPRPADAEGRSSVTTLAVRADGLVVFDVQTFEGTGQCRYQLRWTGASFSGGCDH